MRRARPTFVVLAAAEDDGDLDAVMERGFSAPVREIRAALPGLAAARGRMVVVLGRDDSEPRAGRAAHAAATAAMRGLVTTLEVELGRRGVRVELVEAEDPPVAAAERRGRLRGARPGRSTAPASAARPAP